MRVLLTGGGTAGHINPALAIAETIRKNDASAVIEFVGIKTGKENAHEKNIIYSVIDHAYPAYVCGMCGRSRGNRCDNGKRANGYH